MNIIIAWIFYGIFLTALWEIPKPYMSRVTGDRAYLFLLLVPLIPVIYLVSNGKN